MLESSRREFLEAVAAAAAGIAGAPGSPASSRSSGTAGDSEGDVFAAVNMIGRVTDAGAVVNCVTSEKLGGEVRVRVAWAEGVEALRASPRVGDVVAARGPLRRLELPLHGLRPGRAYVYQVQYQTAAQGGTWKDVTQRGAFRSQRPAGSAFDFCILTDAHWGRRDFNFDLGTAWGRNGAQCIERVVRDGPADFCIDGGDSAFPVRATSQAHADWFYENYRRVMAPLTRRMPVYFVLGNHEQEAGYYRRGDGGAESNSPFGNLLKPEQYQQKWCTESRLRFIPNPRGDTYPEGGEGPPRYDSAADWGAGRAAHCNGTSAHLQNFYAWTWGDALFVVLDPYRYTRIDSNIHPTRLSHWTLGPTQRRFLHDTLAGSKAKWKFVIAHQLAGGGRIDVEGQAIAEDKGYAYGRGTAVDADRPGTEQAQIHAWMKQYGAQFFLYGHDHAFCHSVKDGVNYLTCGRPVFLNDWYDKEGMRASYGNVLVQGRDQPWIKALFTVLGYTRFSVSPTRVAVQWIRTGFSTSSNVPAPGDTRVPRDWRESWCGRKYPVTSPRSVTVARPPTGVDGVRTVAGAQIHAIMGRPQGTNYYAAAASDRMERLRTAEVPLRDFPADTEHAAVVDCVPEVVYECEWTQP